MGCSIRWKRSASKDLRTLPKGVLKRVIAAVNALSQNPYPSGTRKLEGADRNFRLRVGEYRVLYSVYALELVIEIVRVRPRQDAYKN